MGDIGNENTLILKPVFAPLAQIGTFKSTEEFEQAVCDTFDLNRETFPRSFSYRDAINLARHAGWIQVKEGEGWKVTIPEKI